MPIVSQIPAHRVAAIIQHNFDIAGAIEATDDTLIPIGNAQILIGRGELCMLALIFWMGGSKTVTPAPVRNGSYVRIYLLSAG